MSFQITRDGGVWSAYETGSSYQGRFETRADVEQEIRKLQQRELEAAESDLRMAKKKVERTKLALATPIRVDIQPDNKHPVLSDLG